MLDIWFPEKKPLPTAFLVDTSEEALLLPDWLKLRMIRSEVPRLVDAGEPVACLLVFQTLLEGKGEAALLKCAQPSYLDAFGWSHLSLLLLK